VASKLRSLGFDVTDREGLSWDIAVGYTLIRQELHQRYGAAPYGGIEPSRSTANVLFTDPATGQRHGYFDGWADDGCFSTTRAKANAATSASARVTRPSAIMPSTGGPCGCFVQRALS
jgi:hypothetical protein